MKHSKAIGRWFVLSGTLLILPQAAAHFMFGPTLDDVALATAAAVRIPLESLRRTGQASVRFRVPNSDQWKEIRRAWGDHAYIVFVFSTKESTRWILPFGALGLDVQVRDGTRQLALEQAAQPPYTYSSETTDFGRLFRASPGAELQVDVQVAKPDQLPSGELCIQPFWQGPMKDRTVAAIIEDDLRRPIEICAAMGFALVVSGAVLMPWRHA